MKKNEDIYDGWQTKKLRPSLSFGVEKRDNMLEGRVVKVRWVKSYPTAHNHVAIGNVLHETPEYLVLLCKTYHFGNNVGGRKTTLRKGETVGGINEGAKSVRIIPWGRIEVINELPADTNWDSVAHIDQSGLCFLFNEHKTVITRFRREQARKESEV